MPADPDSVVIGIAGHAKSGKTSLAEALAARTGYPVASFGEEVERLAVQQGYSLATEAERRVTLMKLGERLVTEQVETFCASVLEHGKWSPGSSIIVEGIRHADVIHVVRRLVAPTPLYVILVDTPPAVREERLSRDRLGGPLTRATMDAHSTEREISTEVALLADWVVSGEIDPGEAADQILEVLRAGAPVQH
jgi:dephospho-CoA kinase